MNKKKVVIPILASILTLGILTGVSYAYFNAKITENNKTETIMKSNELGLTFTGVSEINANSMIPGDSFTKTFSVENTSNRAVTYNIYMQNITNEFNEDLVYTLSDDNGVVVSEKALPTTNTGKTYLKTNISIDAGVTKNYTLKIEYKYLDTPQNDYQGKTFKATVGIDTDETSIRKSTKVLAKVSNVTDEQPATGTIKVVNNTNETQTYDLMLSDLVDIDELSTGYIYSVEKNEEEVITNEELPTTDQVILENQTIEATQIDNYTISIKDNRTQFVKDSWETIAANVKLGNISAYNIGDTKTIDMGSLGTYTVRIANTSACTNGETSETACGFVVEFAEISELHNFNPANSSYTYGYNEGGWPASAMRTYVNETIYNALPSDLQSVIADTKVVSSHGSTSGETNFTSTDKLYLLSPKEVWGKDGTSNTISYDTAETETRQLDYYKNQGVTTANYGGAKKLYNGTAVYWWLRSAASYNDISFFYVYTSGAWGTDAAYYTLGVAPAFRIA